MDTEAQIVFANDRPASTLSGMASRGEIVRVGPGVYVRKTTDLAATVRANLYLIVGHMLPGAVISDRSGPTAGPVDGVLYLVRDGAPRDLLLPGTKVRVRSGAAAQSDDVALPGGLFMASRPRALAENCLPSRARVGGMRRTLDTHELGDWIDRLCRNEGEARLNEYRRRAEQLADVLNVPADRLRIMRDLVGVALGTNRAVTESQALQARRAGNPVDQDAVARFELLAEALQAAAPQSRPAPVPPHDTFEPFTEAYFSNFIEGTEFDFDEAARIVFDEEIPTARPKDAHDIIGTYRLLADRAEMRDVPTDPGQFVETLCSRHRRIMEGRPEVLPGEFKLIANRAGGTVFVDPGLVLGTLTAGFEVARRLDSAWERAVHIAFVVAEVHPFNDGNGRVARAMMASELEAGGESRLIVPTVFRDDYLDGLRNLSRRDEPGVFIKAMRYAHDFTASIDYSDYVEMRRQLEECNAFEDPNSPRRLRVRGRDQRTGGAPWRTTGVPTTQTRNGHDI